MIFFKWISWIFGGWKKYESLKNDHVDLAKRYLEAVKKDSDKYIEIKSFDISNKEFIRVIAQIAASQELTFMLFNLKQQCVQNMVDGNVDVNLQMTGILKGIDIVIKNLNGYKNSWKELNERSLNEQR